MNHKPQTCSPKPGALWDHLGPLVCTTSPEWPLPSLSIYPVLSVVSREKLLRNMRYRYQELILHSYWFKSVITFLPTLLIGLDLWHHSDCWVCYWFKSVCSSCFLNVLLLQMYVIILLQNFVGLNLCRHSPSSLIFKCDYRCFNLVGNLTAGGTSNLNTQTVTPAGFRFL